MGSGQEDIIDVCCQRLPESYGGLFPDGFILISIIIKMGRYRHHHLQCDKIAVNTNKASQHPAQRIKIKIAISSSSGTYGQKFRQLRTRLHHVFIYVAKTVNTSKSLVLWLCRISLDSVLVKQLRCNTNSYARKQS